MLLSLPSINGEALTVVPNRKLGSFLKDTVAKALAANDASKSQDVIAVVPSDDAIFVAPRDVDITSADEVALEMPRAEPAKRRLSTGRPKERTDNSVRRLRSWTAASDTVKSSQKKNTGHGRRSSRSKKATPASEIEHILQQARSNDWVDSDPRLSGAPHSGPATETVPDFETQTGLTLTGAGIARAEMTHWPMKGSRVEPAPEKATDDLSVLRLHPVAASIGELALELDDGRCLLLPVMQGYICHIAVDAEGVRDVAFVPGWSNWRSEIHAARREKIDRLRALATEAMDQHRFFVGSVKDAKQLASAIRTEKAVDPILGLLAAQAYSEASMSDRVRNVSVYMKHDIQADLFDVRLLANRFWVEEEEYPVIPRCPMLTQNWALLASRRVPLPEPLVQLRTFLTDALWTTFAPGAADIIFDAIDKGAL